MDLRDTTKASLSALPHGDGVVPLEKIIITAELDRRPSRPPDYESESRALARLMDAVAGSFPSTEAAAQQRITSVLQQLVETALQLCRAHSAGISILEQNDEREFFRWRAVAGQWEYFFNGTMPREISPCGTVLDSNTALLMAQPERYYLLPQVEPSIKEVLLVPFHHAGEPVGTIWIIAHDDTREFDAEDYRLVTSLCRFATTIYQLLIEQESKVQLAAQLTSKLHATQQAAETMRANEERYRSLFNAIDAGFCVIEVLFDKANKPVDYRFLEVNAAFEQQSGIENAVGRHMRDIAPQHEEHWFEIYGRIALTGESMRFENAAEQLHRFYDVYAFRTGQPMERKVAVLFNDITSRRATEQALAERERLLSILLRVSDAARNLRDEEDIAHEACRLVKEEIGAVSCSYGFAYPEEDRVVIVADVCDADDGVPCIEGEWSLSGFGPELIALHKQGNPVVIEDTAIHPATAAFQQTAFDPMHTRSLIGIPLVRNGRFVAYFSIHDRVPRRYTEAEVSLLHDVGARVWDAIQRSRAESALRESEARLHMLYAQEQAARAEAEEASRLKDEFVATVSHELRTPLTSFLGYAQLVRRRANDGAYVARTVEKMLNSAKSQAELIDDLLDVSRIVSGKLRITPQPINLTDVIRDAIDTVRPAMDAKGIDLQIDMLPEASPMIGDANRLQQVVWNILSNATKFTPSGGVIHVQLEPHGRDFQLTISDTGQGISPDFLPFVFDRFRQADGASNRAHNGLGLGLAIVRHLVELHGGTVQARSAGEGKGATFVVLLPRSLDDILVEEANEQTNKDDVAGACPPELSGLRILLVDDQPDILELLHDILAACNAVVQTCTTAREALDIVRTWKPEVLVCDISMPNEDGYWLINNIRTLAPEDGGATPAVALTAYVRVEERIHVLEAGFQTYVPKPVEPDELRTVIANLVQTK